MAKLILSTSAGDTLDIAKPGSAQELLAAYQAWRAILPADVFNWADTTPLSESGTGAPGVQAVITRADHVHQRLTSATVHTLDTNGEATVVFTRTFPEKPSWTISWEESANNPPVTCKVKTWTQDGSLNYTGCVIKAYRSQVIPQNLITLLAGAVFNVFAGSANGLQVSFIALKAS